MMRLLQRIVFWVLLVAFIAVSVVWFFSVPYRPERLYRVLPANSVFVSHHRLLADRWDEFFENPLAQTLLASAGLDVDELLDWSEDPEIRPWLDKLLARDVIISYVPELGPTREPAWILAGWIGGESVRLRWLLQRGVFPDFLPEPRQGGGGYWRLDDGDMAAEHLSITVMEGMLVGVFSPNPHAVRHVLDVYDGLTPGLLQMDPEAVVFHSCRRDSEVLDQGWFIGLDLDGRRVRYRFELDQINAAGLGGAVCMPADGEWPHLQAQAVGVPSHLLGGIPFLLLAAQPDALYTVLQGRMPSVGDLLLQGLYETTPEGIVMGSVQGGDYGGSLFGIAVPSLVLLWPVADETEAAERIQRLLDDLNARWQWGLVASPVATAGPPVYIIESTTQTTYARFRDRERIAYTWIDGWLVLASHSRPLLRLIERSESPAALIESNDGGWLPGIREHPSALHGYWDIRAGARTLRMVISAYSMKLLFEDRAGSRETRQQLTAVREWLDLLESLSSARVWLDQNDGVRMIRFQLGESEETP